jgi:hypothetical protein
MKTSIIVGIVFLFIGGAISYYCFAGGKVKYVSASVNITEIRKVKQLHLVTHFYEDVLFLHRGDDTLKAIQAIISVPVQIAGFVDLEKSSVDTVKKELLVPYPQLTEPLYSVPQAKFVRRVFLGKPSDYINRYAKMLEIRKPIIVAKATTNKIFESAKEECEAYFSKLFKSLGVDYKVVFMDAPKR